MAEQHGKTLVPQIRFAGFTDPWEQRKLGELFVIGGSGGTPSATNASYYGGDIPFLGISDIKNRDITITAKSITEKGLENSAAWIIPAGSICLAMYASVGKAGINRVSLATSQAFYNMVFEDETLRDFIYTRLEKADTDNEWNPLISTGTQANLNADKVKSFRILLPSSDERRLIAKYFADLDSLITLHQRKYDKLCVLKKSMLDKMFPKGGSLYPEIRFAGFTDPWEQRKLGEVASGFEYGLNAAASDFDGEKKYLRITDIDDQTREFRTDDLSSPDINNPIDDRYLLKEGDILFARTGASVGKTYLYKASDGKTYYAGFLIRAHVSDEADAGFIFQSTLTERYKQFVLLTSQRSGQPGINAQEYSDLLLPLPSLMEQRRIGAFFDRLDSLITLHQRKLELLRNIKKSMLDKMFV